ncbi:protein kinase domain-containing protein [Penicillium psychrosexuale]|uniref:protein kinase domain-containing protein n=1 Tax=Penicillium psychrosexuale TaxID=1002107 RepID=UPI0025455F09|nr:protein kinase domain-containing protein [Penicillium psychrosexuale]KAJ5800226.1 protein kinase domain-containing protein [Penicillium psychrosexuale]
MPTTTALSPFTSDLELKSYCEDQDFLCNGEPEPNSRSQTLIYHFENKKWWIKVTFKGAISSFPQNKTKCERRKEYQDFVKLIDFDPLALLDDTVSESAGIAVFNNLYATSQNVEQMVIGGILLEYYSGGSLQRVLSEQRIRRFGWERWAIQIGNALSIIHGEKKTHMDLKPSNIVLDDDGNAVIIDISGIGGITYNWLAPEIRGEMSRLDLPFQTRRLNDVWAYGKILTEIALNAGNSPFARTLRWVADHLTKDVDARWTLSDGLSHLKNAQCVD